MDSESYFRQQGKPVAFYSDKHGIFRINTPSVGHGDALTQFGRAMRELDIQIICANTPQVKGIERVNQTLQDRLVKEMRLRGISSMVDGNVYLPEFIGDLNQRFAVEPRSFVDAHRALTTKDDLTTHLTWQEQRVISTVRFDKVVHQIQTKRPSYALRNARVTICVAAQQQVSILYKGKSLAHTNYHQQAKQSEVGYGKGFGCHPQRTDLCQARPGPPLAQNGCFQKSRKCLRPAGGDISILS